MIPIWVSIILIFVLILLNAVLSGSESALVAINPHLVDELATKGEKKAKRIQKFLAQPTPFFSTTQIGMTFMGFINGILAADALTEPLLNLITSNSAEIWGGWSIIIQIIITAFLTFFQVVFGELVPKRLSMRYPKGFLYFSIWPVTALYFITRPFVFLFTKTANGVVRIFGLKPDDSTEAMTEAEIRMLVKAGGAKGVIEKEESEMIANILDFTDLTAESVMTHRTDMSAISINATRDEVINFALDEQYTRFPVYEKNIDHIVGILNVKDLFRYIAKPRLKFDLKVLIKKPFFIPDTQLISQTFAQMKQKKVHIAIVLDEYGGTAGMITIEDLLEEIVGSILDEHDTDENENLIEKVDDHTYIVEGLTSINDVEDAIHAGLPVTDYTTLSGFILGELGHFPHTDEKIKIKYLDVTYEVVSYVGSIIGKIKVTMPKHKEENND